MANRVKEALRQLPPREQEVIYQALDFALCNELFEGNKKRRSKALTMRSIVEPVNERHTRVKYDASSKGKLIIHVPISRASKRDTYLKRFCERTEEETKMWHYRGKRIDRDLGMIRFFFKHDSVVYKENKTRRVKRQVVQKEEAAINFLKQQAKSNPELVKQILGV